VRAAVTSQNLNDRDVARVSISIINFEREHFCACAADGAFRVLLLVLPSTVGHYVNRMNHSRGVVSSIKTE